MEGELRPVQVPNDEIKECYGDTKEILELVYHWGQNENQNVQKRCSVSVGDVAHLYGKFFVCGRFGWKELTPQQYQDYEKIERRDRDSCEFVK
jgi:hypothetical protein